MNKFYLWIILFILCYTRSFAQCGNITLTTQAQVDAYPSTYGCSSVTSLFIFGSDITHLDSLYQIQSAGRFRISRTNVVNLHGLEGVTTGTNLEILENPLLADFTGLNNLENVGGTVEITLNQSLTSFNGLGKLKYVNNLIHVESNSNLTTFDGMDSLAHPGSIEIVRNPALSDISAFSIVTNTSNLIIRDNDALTSLNGLQNITTLWSLQLTLNDKLTNLDGLASLDSIRTDILIDRNSTLASIAGLNGIRYVNNFFIWNSNALTNVDGLNTLVSVGYLWLDSNPVLTNLNGFSGLKRARIIRMHYNPALINIDGLSSVQTVTEVVFIDLHQSLLNLNGLSGISGSLVRLLISNNPLIQNLDAFHGITSVGSSVPNENGTGLDIALNSNLQNIDGLSAITKIEGWLTVGSNPGLKDLAGLSSLKEVTSTMSIGFNTGLVSLNGLQALEKVGGNVDISLNGALASLSGLSSLQSVGGSFRIANNDVLKNLSGLGKLTSIGEGMRVYRNSSLINLEGLNSLSSIGVDPKTSEQGLDPDPTFSSLQIAENNSLITIGSLKSLKTLPGALTIGHNPVLRNLDGLNSLTSISGVVGIAYNPSLINIDGLSSLKEVTGGGVRINNNEKLLQLDGFKSLTAIRSSTLAYLRIENNAALKNIDGLSSLVTLSGATANLQLTNNTSLARCCGLYPLLHNGGISGPGGVTITISGNGSGCTREDIEAGGPCKGQGSSQQPTVLTFTVVTDKSMHISFTPPAKAPDGYITLMSVNAPPDKNPQDGSSYYIGQKIGNSTVVASGPQTAADIKGLLPNTTYYFKVFSFSFVKGDDGCYGDNYVTEDPLTGSHATTAPSDAFSSSSKVTPFPNPFVDDISIPFTTTEDDTFVNVSVHDQAGRKVAEIISDRFSAGYHEVQWDRRDYQGKRVENGMYIYRIQSSGKEGSATGVVVAK
jgi:hypothetical protein